MNRKRVIEKAEIYRSITCKYKNLNRASKATGVKWSTLNKACTLKETEQQHGLSLPPSTVDAVGDFYVRPSISIQLPDAKRGVNKRFLNRSLMSAHETFKKDNPNKKVGFSTFAKMRPHNVKLLESTPNRQCVCQQCANFELSGKALAAAGVNVTTDKFIAINLSLFPFDKHPHMDCITRKCK